MRARGIGSPVSEFTTSPSAPQSKTVGAAGFCTVALWPGKRAAAAKRKRTDFTLTTSVALRHEQRKGIRYCRDRGGQDPQRLTVVLNVDALVFGATDLHPRRARDHNPFGVVETIRHDRAEESQ